jgi:RNA polymerase sigma-70 factor (ECF subfamily)
MCVGNIDGLSYLVEKYGLKAVRAATLITCDRAMAEDVVQEAFIRAYERISQFDIDRPFGPWFLRSISNASLRAVQRRGRTSPLEDAFGRDEPTDLAGPRGIATHSAPCCGFAVRLRSE